MTRSSASLRSRKQMASQIKADPQMSAHLLRPIATAIERKLKQALKPAYLSVVNESQKHAGHAGNPSGAPDAETHFRVEVVSDSFLGQNAVKRHRLVYETLREELDAGLHALALKTKTPAETDQQKSKPQ